MITFVTVSPNMAVEFSIFIAVGETERYSLPVLIDYRRGDWRGGVIEVELDVRGNCVTASPNTAVASNTAVGETDCVGVGPGMVRAFACATIVSVGSVGLYTWASLSRPHMKFQF